jgi:sodium/potassium-transporting ATPase subunit alpha
LVLLEQGDNVAADCRLIEGFALRVDNSTVTGESMPQARAAGACADGDLIHSRNVLLAGTSVVSGQGRAVVFATGLNTEFGKIAHLAQAGGGVVSPLRKQLAYLSRLIAALAVGIGVIFFAIGAALDIPIWLNFIFTIGLISSMVPEGLLPTLTLALTLAAQRLAKRNVLIRNLSSVETLGSATVICTDKTGTLTQNRMEARELLLGGEHHIAGKVMSQPELVRRYFSFFEAARLSGSEGNQRGRHRKAPR